MVVRIRYTRQVHKVEETFDYFIDEANPDSLAALRQSGSPEFEPQESNLPIVWQGLFSWTWVAVRLPLTLALATSYICLNNVVDLDYFDKSIVVLLTVFSIGLLFEKTREFVKHMASLVIGLRR